MASTTVTSTRTNRQYRNCKMAATSAKWAGSLFFGVNNSKHCDNVTNLSDVVGHYCRGSGKYSRCVGKQSGCVGKHNRCFGKQSRYVGKHTRYFGTHGRCFSEFHPCFATNKSISCRISGEVYIALLISGVLLHNLYYQTRLIYQSSRGFYFETAPLLLKDMVYWIY